MIYQMSGLRRSTCGFLQKIRSLTSEVSVQEAMILAMLTIWDPEAYLNLARFTRYKGTYDQWQAERNMYDVVSYVANTLYQD